MKATLKKEMVGICKVCGNVEVRPAPADTAVCGKCYANPRLVVEVLLRSKTHPTFRFEVTDVSVINKAGERE